MKRTRSMSAWLVAWLFAGLIFASFTLPSHAQSAKEAPLSGTISSVIEKWSPDMTMPGAHLLLSTSTGVVDASLGKFGLEGRGALSVKAGQSVEVTGVMKTLKEKQVFVARTVTFGGQVYTMRNKHGVAVSAQGRERASRLATQKGASL
jgi:hypothetical protein